MRQMSFRLLMFVMTSTPICVNAQIIPDNTLLKPSIVNQSGNTQVITGGTSLTDNLFHSFSQFSILPNGIAQFQHERAVTNLLVRVTGNVVSNIDGKLETSLINDATNRGEANVFLLNPNGIIFGKDSSLNLGGSFIGTTADSITLSDGSKFSVRHAEDTLLTVAVPIGLQFGDRPGNIENRSSTFPGLRVPEGKTIALIGGDLEISNGYLFSRNGNVELAAVGATNQSGVTFSGISKLVFDYKNVTIFKNIVLSKNSRLSLIGDVNTIANLQGNNITFQEGSQLNSTASSAMGSPQSLITVNAKGKLDITGVQSKISSTTTINPGTSINIKSQNVSVSQGGSIFTGTTGTGKGGDLIVEADSTINLNTLGELTATISTSSQGSGNAGNLSVKSRVLEVQNGAQLNSLTTKSSSANSGNIVLNITDLISLQGSILIKKDPKKPIGKPTVVSTESLGKTGNAGNLKINTKRLEVLGGAQVITSILGEGNAGLIDIESQEIEVAGVGEADGRFLYLEPLEGQVSRNPNRLSSVITSNSRPGSTGKGADLNIKADRLTVRDGAVIQSATFGSGNAGNITVTAKESILLQGVAPNPDDPFPSSIIAFSGGIPNKNVFSVPEAIGKGGNITIDTPNLKLTNGALIALGSLNSTPEAKGAGELLKINAGVISLDRAELNAQTNAGNGGKFDITANGLLILRNGSKIITQAGGINQGGNAGNITIKSPLIIAKKTENSDINANAAKGNGGTIDITADSIVGLEVRPKLTDFSDITASSDRGVQGTITLNGPNIDPDRGTVVLPIATSDPSNRLDQSCSADRSVSGQFTIGGQGGLPASPQTPSSITPVSRLATVPPSTDRSTSTQTASPVTTIREAQASQRLANGKIRFTSTSIGNATPIGLTPHCR